MMLAHHAMAMASGLSERQPTDSEKSERQMKEDLANHDDAGKAEQQQLKPSTHRTKNSSAACFSQASLMSRMA
jgi:hypothetical protein